MSQLALRYAAWQRLPAAICASVRNQSSVPREKEPSIQQDGDSNSPQNSTCQRSFGAVPVPEEPKPFKQIPGPLSLPFVGTLYLYLCRIYQFSRLHRNGWKKFHKYGPLVREEIIPKLTVVWVFDPDDIETVFRSETGYPERRSHLAIDIFRKSRPDVYNSGGLIPTNGPEWWRLRKEFQKGLSAPRSVRTYLPATDIVISDFVSTRLARHHDDVLPELSRLFLQLTCLVAFDINLNSFSPQEMKPDSLSTRLMEAAVTANSAILILDNQSQKWKKKETPLYKEFKEAMLVIEEVAVDLVEKKVKALENVKITEDDENIPSLLESYLSSPALNSKDVVGMAVDMLLAGIDTTTYTACFALYHLAKNPSVQEKLRMEAYRLLGNPGEEVKPVTAEVLQGAPYARAVLKEVFRMNPVSVGIGRITTQDIVLSGYHIPAGTVVVTQNQVSSRLPKYCTQPDDFIPERWLKGHPLQLNASPYLVLPFGHGPRSCIARRLAEQHLLTLLLKTVHQYNILWLGKPTLDCESLLINRPDSPVKLQFSAV